MEQKSRKIKQKKKKRTVFHYDDGKLVKFTKNGEPRLVVLNNIAKTIVERQRGNHNRFVFAHCHRNSWRQMYAMNTNGWKAARIRAGIPDVRIHDLRHTFGRRLRSAGVSYEDRQDLLGHKSSRMTTHYSAAEIKNLIDAADKLCEKQISTPTLKVIQGGVLNPTKSPHGSFGEMRKSVSL